MSSQSRQEGDVTESPKYNVSDMRLLHKRKGCGPRNQMRVRGPAQPDGESKSAALKVGRGRRPNDRF